MTPSIAAINPTDSRRSLADCAYDAIYRNIVTLTYGPGQYLEEGRLTEGLGIGRTPIREALQRLAADMLVESRPGKGFIVRPLTLQNTKAAFAALRIFELGVASLAARQAAGDTLNAMRTANGQMRKAVQQEDIFSLVEANSRFHDLYARCSQNVYLVQALRKVRCETNRLAYLSYGNEIHPSRQLKDHYASVLKQHGQMIDAIAQHDETHLRQIVIAHIEIFKKRIIRYLANF